MLKLMKYEFIHSMRSFMISFCVFLGACILLPFFSEGIIPDIPFLTFAMAFGFTVLIMGICIALFVSIFTRYYHSMFKRPAYLNLTLPVSSLQLIISKIVVTFLWFIIASFVLGVGVLLMGLVSEMISGNASDFFKGLPEFLKVITDYIWNHPAEILETIITMFIEVYSLVIFIYFSLTVVHTKLCRHHRIALGVCLWIVLGIAYSYLLNFVVGFGIGMVNFGNGVTTLYYVVSLICSFLLTILTAYVLDHHIEIE